VRAARLRTKVGDLERALVVVDLGAQPRRAHLAEIALQSLHGPRLRRVRQGLL